MFPANAGNGSGNGNGNGSVSTPIEQPAKAQTHELGPSVRPPRRLRLSAVCPHILDFPSVGIVARRIALAALATCALIACRWAAYQLRFDFAVPQEYQTQLHDHWIWIIAVQLFWLLVFRQFSGIYCYFSLVEVRYLAYATIFSGISLYAVHYHDPGLAAPKGVILVECLLSFLALGGMRVLWRLYHEHFSPTRRNGSHVQRKVAIIGAGDVGANLVHELYARPNLGLLPVVFLDDDRKKWGSRIHGVPVVGSPDRVERYKGKFGFEEVVFAMPSASAKRIGEIVGLLQTAHLKYVTVPSVDQLTSGAVRVTQLRAVNVEDLLGREPIDLEVDQIGNILKGRVVVVTGAGGSIGSELCRQIASFRPQRLLLVEQSEVQMFQIEQELVRLGHKALVTPVIADILDEPRVRAVLGQHKPAAIFHAAAHKHVGMMEIQPGEAIKNNALGTALLAELAAEYGVEHFVMISTDKAVNPTSVMGASKRLAEVFLE